MATTPLRSGFAEINSSRRVPGNEGSGVPIREQPCCTYRSRCFSNTANVEGIDAEISCSHYVGFEVIEEVDILGC